MKKQLSLTLEEAQNLLTEATQAQQRLAVVQSEIQSLILRKEILQKKIDSLDSTYSQKEGDLRLAFSKKLKALEIKLSERLKELDNSVRTIKANNDRCDSLNKEAQELQATINNLHTQIDALNGKIESLNVSASDIEQVLSDNSANNSKILSEIAYNSEKLKEGNNSLVEVQKRVAQVTEELKILDTQYTKRKEDQERYLKSVMIKATDAMESYREAQSQESSLRGDIAQRTLALDRREEVISRRESKLENAEQRMSEYNRRMKL